MCTWANQFKLIAKDQYFILNAATKKERQLWLAELSRAIELSDQASPVKASRKKPQKGLTKEMEN